jgi:hypothetical protein
MIPSELVMQVVFEGGYKEALAHVRKEANENAAMQLGSIMSQDPDGEMGQDVPYDKEKVPNIDDSRAYL